MPILRLGIGLSRPQLITAALTEPFLTLESGSFLLLETNDHFLLETNT